MTPETVFAKSPKGIEEIDTRAHRLSPKLRQALIRVDGIKTLDELLGEAGDMGEALLGQIEELVRQGFLLDTTVVEEVASPAPPAPPPRTSAPAPRTAPAAAPAVKPSPAPAKPAASQSEASAAVEFDSPVKWRLQDMLVDAVGFDTGKLGLGLKACRNRDELARWVEASQAPIEQIAGKSKSKAFYKNAKKLVGG